MFNAIVLYPVLEKNRSKSFIENKLLETCNLAKAIKLNIIHKEFFYLKKPDPGNLLRKGKIDYYIQIINNMPEIDKADIIIFSIDISAIQQRNLEKLFNLKVLDKTSLILEIFGDRAVSKEGTIQVELAHLNWQKSRLVRSWTHLERQRGGFGFLGGPGESQIELDKRMIGKRIKQLKLIMQKIKKTRDIQADNRKNTKIPVISLLGYTNAGKSSLFNRLTSLNVDAKNKLFETLDTKISNFYLPNIKKAYITDTVGFISDLPTLLIESFKSTLEEIRNADLLIHVRDFCAEDKESQKDDVLEVLKQLNIYPNTSDGPNMIEVLNKVDMVTTVPRENISPKNHQVFVSAKTGEGIDNLKNKIESFLLN